MANPKRARSRKRRTRAKGTHLPLYAAETGHRRAGCPPRGGIRKACGEVPGRNRGSDAMMNRSAEGGTWSSPHYGGEGVLTPPPHQGVCGRHGTEDSGVTPGELAASPAGNGGKRPYKPTRRRGGVTRREWSDGRIVPQARRKPRDPAGATSPGDGRVGRGRRPAEVVGTDRPAEE